MRKLILLLMMVVFVTTIITVESARPDEGRACRRAGGKCVRSNRAARICKEYADDANDCGESKECCLVKPSQRTARCTGECDVGTCTPKQRCPEEMRRGGCGKKCVCCTKVKLSKSNGNESDEMEESSEEEKPLKPGQRARSKESRPKKGKQRCVTTDECSNKGGKCKKKCKKNGDSSLCGGDCTCCGICQPKGKCNRFDGVCKSSCDGTEREITRGCKKKCSCCAPKCTQNGCQGQCVSKRKECNGNFIKNGCGGFKCHCCTSGGKLCNMPK